MSFSLRSSAFALFEKGSGLIFGFGTLFALLRALSKEALGVWVLFLTITSFVEVARMGLIQNALVRFLTISDEEECKRITTASAFINGILTIFAIAVTVVPAGFFSRLWQASYLEPMLYLNVLTMLMLGPLYHVNFVQQANLDFKGIFLANFIRRGILFFYVVTLFFYETPIELLNLVWVQITGALVAFIVSFLWARKYVKFSKVIDWAWVKTLFGFGKYVFGTNINAMLYKSMDKLMIGGMVSNAAVAIYELAIRLANLAEVPSYSIASVLYPHSSKKVKEEGTKAVGKLYEHSAGIILAIVLPFAIIVLGFPRVIIQIVGGEKYLDAVPLLRLTMLYTLFIPFAVQFGTVLDAIGKPKVNFFFTIIGILINFSMNFVFILKYGLIGAAWGTLLTYFITFVIQQIVLYKILRVRFYRAFYNIFSFYRYCWSFLIHKLFGREKEIRNYWT